MRCIRSKASHPLRPQLSLHACTPQPVLAYRAVKEFAENYIKSGKKLHCLINNAGTALPPHSITKDGFEVQEPNLSVVTSAHKVLPAMTAMKDSLVKHACTHLSICSQKVMLTDPLHSSFR